MESIGNGDEFGMWLQHNNPNAMCPGPENQEYTSQTPFFDTIQYSEFIANSSLAAPSPPSFYQTPEDHDERSRFSARIADRTPEMQMDMTDPGSPSQTASLLSPATVAVLEEGARESGQQQNDEDDSDIEEEEVMGDLLPVAAAAAAVSRTAARAHDVHPRGTLYLDLGAVKEPAASQEHKKLGWDLFIDADASKQVIKGTIRKPSDYGRLRDSFNRAKNNAKSQGLAIINFLEASPEVLYLEVKQSAKLPLRFRLAGFSDRECDTGVLSQTIKDIEACRFTPVEAPVSGTKTACLGFLASEKPEIDHISKLDWIDGRTGYFRVKVPKRIGFWKIALFRGNGSEVPIPNTFIKILSRNTVYKVEKGSLAANAKKKKGKSSSSSSSDLHNSNNTSSSSNAKRLRSSSFNNNSNSNGVEKSEKFDDDYADSRRIAVMETEGQPPQKRVRRMATSGMVVVNPLPRVSSRLLWTIDPLDVYERLLIVQELGHKYSNAVNKLVYNMDERKQTTKPYVSLALAGFHFHTGSMLNSLKNFDRALKFMEERSKSFPAASIIGTYIQCMISNIHLWKSICLHGMARDRELSRCDSTRVLQPGFADSSTSEIRIATEIYTENVGTLELAIHSGDSELSIMQLALLELQITFKSNLGVILAQQGQSKDSQRVIEEACVTARKFQQLWSEFSDDKKREVLQLFDGLSRSDDAEQLPAIEGEAKVQELATRGVWMNSASTSEVWFEMFEPNLDDASRERAVRTLEGLVIDGMEEAKRLYSDSHRCVALCEIYALLYSAIVDRGSSVYANKWQERLRFAMDVIEKWHMNAETFEVYQIQKIGQILQQLFETSDVQDKYQLMTRKRERLYRMLFPRRYRMVSPFDLIHARVQEEMIGTEN